MQPRFEQVSHPLDLDEKPELYRKGFLGQIVGKLLILGFVLMGLLGLFGHGFMSNKAVRKGNAIVAYERFSRVDGQMKMEVAMTSVTGKSAVSLPLTYLRQVRVEQVVPEPERTFVRDGQMWFVFEAEQNLQAQFFLKPLYTGNIHSIVWVNDQNLPLHHFIYP